MDSVKSIVTVLEEGDFTEEGVVSTGGVLFSWRIPLFVEEGCVLISRRGSSSSGVGGHSSLEEGCVLISRRGSSSSGVGGHTSLEEGCIFDREEGIILSLDKGYILISRGLLPRLEEGHIWNGASSCR